MDERKIDGSETMNVYYTDRSRKRQQKYHHSEDCTYLQHAGDVIGPIEKDKLSKDWTACKYCSGVAETTTDELNSATMSGILSRCNPEDIGLTPMGERHE